MINAVLLFLVVMAVIGIYGRIKRMRQVATHCKSCGRPRIGKGPCPCGKGA